jgi:hypothetical protein
MKSISFLSTTGKAALGVLLAFAVFATPQALAEDAKPTIDLTKIQAAQDAWGEGLIAIGKAHKEGGDPKAVAVKMLETVYDYPDGKVLFKPTLTHGEQTFRPTFEGALAYFVGGDPNFPNDSGFALNGWVESEEKIDSFVVHGNVVIVMGNVTLTSPDGDKVTVDKTFAYRLDDDGNLRIITHHSSLPFTPAAE